VCAIGGPSVSASPEMYSDFDYLHIGEVGDATDALIALLDRDIARPAAQQRFENRRTPAAAGLSDPRPIT
jgi:hypothetical protein